jgi:hypothetical protein
MLHKARCSPAPADDGSLLAPMGWTGTALVACCVPGVVCGMAIWVSYPYTTSADAKGGGEQNRLVARESCCHFCCQ